MRLDKRVPERFHRHVLGLFVVLRETGDDGGLFRREHLVRVEFCAPIGNDFCPREFLVRVALGRRRVAHGMRPLFQSVSTTRAAAFMSGMPPFFSFPCTRATWRKKSSTSVNRPVLYMSMSCISRTSTRDFVHGGDGILDALHLDAVSKRRRARGFTERAREDDAR